MLAYIAGDGLTRMQQNLQRIARPPEWISPILEEGATIVRDHNRMNLMMGRSFTGKTFDKVKRKHGGPPLLEGKGPPPYRAIELAVVDTGQIDDSTFEIRLSWPQFKSKKGRDILSMHMVPYKNRPARKAVGIPKSAANEVTRVIRRYLSLEFSDLTDRISVKANHKQGSIQITMRR
jgi:hypothetical protein